MIRLGVIADDADEGAGPRRTRRVQRHRRDEIRGQAAVRVGVETFRQRRHALGLQANARAACRDPNLVVGTGSQVVDAVDARIFHRVSQFPLPQPPVETENTRSRPKPDQTILIDG